MTRSIRLRLCPACGGKLRAFVRATDENRRVAPTVFPYLKCPGCGSIWIERAPRRLGDWYPRDYHFVPEDSAALARSIEPERYRIRIVQRYKRAGRLLEIGPGNGIFTHLALEAGFSVEAIEVDRACCNFLRREQGIKVVCTGRPESSRLRPAGYDVIAFWHSLEHLPQPVRMLDAAVRWLRPGGVLLIAVPNPESLQMRLMGRRWPHLDAPRHLAFLTLGALTAILERKGLERLMVTARDAGGRHWNRFGWERLLMNRTVGRFAGRILRGIGMVIAAAALPLELAGLNGATYTAVFRKRKEGSR